jgi:hypothetical protein
MSIEGARLSLVKLRIGAVCLLLATPLLAATVKKQNGEIVKGQIMHLVVQQEEVQKEFDREENRNTFSTTFYAINGPEITAIDEEGIHTLPGSVVGVFIVVGNTVPPDPLEVMQTAEGPSLPAPLGLRTLRKGGGFVAVARRGLEKPTTGKLLGYYTIEGGKGRLVPALEVITETGKVTLPLRGLVAINWKKQSEKENKEKQ